MDKRLFVISARLFFAALNIAAIVMQLMYSSQYAISFSLINFFSYFTILSNVFVSIVFVMSAWSMARGRKPTVTDDTIRGASVLYMVVTGIVYVMLLAGQDVDLTLPWVNLQLHYVMPIVVVLDWFYRPQRSTLRVRQALVWLIFPVLYVLYSLVRGPIANWYPYPFLDPAKTSGYGGVALYCLLILAVLSVAGVVLVLLGNVFKRQAND